MSESEAVEPFDDGKYLRSAGCPAIITEMARKVPMGVAERTFTAENIAIGLIEPMYPVTTPEPSSTFSLDLSLGERTQVHGWPPVPDVYEAEVADRVRQQQARNRLASIREIAAARNARLGLHDDPSDDAEDDGEIVQKAAIRALTDAGRRMVIDPGAVPCALVEWEDKRVDL